METIEKLKLECYEGKATAETFEKAIKKEGLTMKMILIIASYYKEDLENYDLIKF